jgi:replicative DNA helicase
MTSMTDLTGNMVFQEKAAPLERQILATLLDMPSCMQHVGDIIEASDFLSESARQVFSWIRAQTKANFEISPALAQARFSGVTTVEPFLMNLMLEMPSVNAVGRHAEELRDIAARRDTVNALQKNLPELMKPGSSIESVLNKISEGLQKTTGRLSSNQNSVRSYADVGVTWREKFRATVERGGGISGLQIHYTELDDMLSGLQEADLIIIGGRPSMGKTTFAMNLVENVAIKGKCATLVFSLEMPSEQIYQRSLASVGGINFNDLRSGRLQVGDDAKLEVAITKLDEAQIFIDDEAGLTLAQLSSRAIRMHKEHDIKLIMIDYLQLMTPSDHNIGNVQQGISEISRGLKQLAKKLNIPVIALSQLSRNLEQRPNKRPVNSDLRESGAIEQDADVIMFVYRDEVYNPDTKDKGIAEIIIGKQRNGPLGTSRLAFGGAQSSFRNIEGSVPTTLSANREKIEARRLASLKGVDGKTEQRERIEFPQLEMVEPGDHEPGQAPDPNNIPF